MPLTDGQIQVRDLVMGPGTAYQVGKGFNPWRRHVRAISEPRAWGHGTSSGAEWAAEAVVPVPIRVSGVDGGAWLALQQQLSAAFAPVGDSGVEVELRFAVGGREYVMFGRPRMVEPELKSWALDAGSHVALCAFVALDPRIYDGTEASQQFGLPTFTGGLTVPFTVPFTIDAVTLDGQTSLTNEGTAETGLTLRIDGPVEEPRVVLQRPDGVVQTLRLLFDLTSTQHVFIDTAARTVLLNGLPQASRRGQVSGDFPLLPAGTSTLKFRAADNAAAGTVTVSGRSAWW